MNSKVRMSLANAEDYLLYALGHMQSDGSDEEELAELQTAVHSIKRVLRGE